MTKIRVLTIDDSVVVRSLLSEAIAQDPDLELIGYAPNGKIGLERIEELKPHVVVLDVEMPELNGIQTLIEIRKKHKTLPVIMYSTLTQKGAQETVKALSLGATDYASKPTNSASLANSKDTLKTELLPKIRLHGARFLQVTIDSLKKSGSAVPGISTKSYSVSSGAKNKIEVVAIGVSTGGPNALEKLLVSFPKEFPVPIVIVQHMPPTFTKMLADHLNVKCQLTVKEAVQGDLLLPGHVLIAPGGFHMIVEQGGHGAHASLTSSEPENSCRPSVDVLFRSVHSVFGNKVLSVIMTGMGSDGLRGCELLHKSGAPILVQDEDSSVVWGMPGFVAKAGIANAILPLDQLANEIIGRASFGRLAGLKPVAAMGGNP